MKVEIINTVLINVYKVMSLKMELVFIMNNMLKNQKILLKIEIQM